MIVVKNTRNTIIISQRRETVESNNSYVSRRVTNLNYREQLILFCKKAVRLLPLVLTGVLVRKFLV